MDTRPYRLTWPGLSIVYDVSPGRIFNTAIQQLRGISYFFVSSILKKLVIGFLPRCCAVVSDIVTYEFYSFLAISPLVPELSQFFNTAAQRYIIFLRFIHFEEIGDRLSPMCCAVVSDIVTYKFYSFLAISPLVSELSQFFISTAAQRVSLFEPLNCPAFPNHAVPSLQRTEVVTNKAFG
jgi:hypothetical protein